MSKGLLQKRVEVQGLATAILLPSVGVFGGPIGSEAGELGPLTSVVGIGLFQRTVLTLQRAGIRQLIVLPAPMRSSSSIPWRRGRGSPFLSGGCQCENFPLMILGHGTVKSKATMVGSDGSLTNSTGHPRAAGSFCRVLGHYSRDLKLISLPEAIAKMTIMPARRFEKRCPESRRKGRVQVGADADLAIFDPRTVIDRATFEKPRLTSVGMKWVLIGGKTAVEEGRLIEDARLGKGLRSKRSG